MANHGVTAQWMLDHPNDTPCPAMADAAKGWRRKRGLEQSPQQKAKQAEYEAIMREKKGGA
jgi:hypothetical protein